MGSGRSCVCDLEERSRRRGRIRFKRSSHEPREDPEDGAEDAHRSLVVLGGVEFVVVVDDTTYCFIVCADVLRMCLVGMKEAMGLNEDESGKWKKEEQRNDNRSTRSPFMQN